MYAALICADGIVAVIVLTVITYLYSVVAKKEQGVFKIYLRRIYRP